MLNSRRIKFVPHVALASLASSKKKTTTIDLCINSVYFPNFSDLFKNVLTWKRALDIKYSV